MELSGGGGRGRAGDVGVTVITGPSPVFLTRANNVRLLFLLGGASGKASGLSRARLAGTGGGPDTISGPGPASTPPPPSPSSP